VTVFNGRVHSDAVQRSWSAPMAESVMTLPNPSQQVQQQQPKQQPHMKETRPLSESWKGAMYDGLSLGLWKEGQQQIQKGPDAHLPVLHKLMAKHLVEDEKGDIFLVGTIVQAVAGISDDTTVVVDGTEQKYTFRKFRLNDVSAKDDEMEFRRSKPLEGFGNSTTMNVCIPMKTKPVFSVPPYQIMECTALIEMQTSAKEYMKDGVKYKSDVRPNMQISQKDERELFIIRNKDELNMTDSYDLITEAARVEAKYDKEKGYMPKYAVTFYVEKSPMYALTATFLPLLAVVGLASINVLSGEGEGPNLENSIALVLTMVFILPNLRPAGRGDRSKSWLSYLLSNNVCIILLFLGLGATSFTHPALFDDRDFGGRKALPDNHTNSTGEYVAYYSDAIWEYAEMLGVVGMIFFGLAILIPMLNLGNYLWYKWNITSSAKIHVQGQKERLAFCKDKSFNKFDIKTEPVFNPQTGQSVYQLTAETATNLKDLYCVSHRVFADETTQSNRPWQLMEDDAKTRVLSSGPNHQ